MKCRHCKKNLVNTFIDLGSSPPSNSYISKEDLDKNEKWYPLKVMVCDNCWLVQTVDFVDHDEMFSKEYAYFSSFSSSWLQHSYNYVETVTKRFDLNSRSRVVEVAANDGYLLQYIKKKKIPCYGIEPTKGTAREARKKGIKIEEYFFNSKRSKNLVSQNRQADLIIANNVLAHVPNINDFVKAFSILLKPEGVATFEFQHLLNLIEKKQFDTIYHEHYSYLSLITVKQIFEHNNLDIFDVEELNTHGGSLRVYAKKKNSRHKISKNVQMILNKEKRKKLNKLSYYKNFQFQAEMIKNELLSFLIKAKLKGKKVAAYGAAAKGNTILNFAGVRSDLIKFVVDLNPAKKNKYMPGSRIPIVDKSKLDHEKPDYIIILPWNLAHEISKQLNYVKKWNCKLLISIPLLKFIK